MYISVVAGKNKKTRGVNEDSVDPRIGKIFVLSEDYSDLKEEQWTILDKVVIDEHGKEKTAVGILYRDRAYLFLGTGKSHGRRIGGPGRGKSAIEHHFLADKLYRFVFQPSRFFKIFKRAKK